MKMLNSTISLIAFVSCVELSSALYYNDAQAQGEPAVMEAPVAPVTVVRQTREEFARTMAQSALAVIKDHDKPFAEKQALLKQQFSSVVDVNWIARFVLGSAWNTATPEQREQYTALYRVYLTNTYVANFDEESERKVKSIKISSVKEAQDGNFIVHTEVALSDADDARVDYLVADKGDEYKVIDIIIEGVSMLATHRSEFAELTASKGVNGLIGQLQQMVGQSTLAMSITPGTPKSF